MTRTASTPAVAAVVRAGVGHKLHQVEHDPGVTNYGREIVEALGADPARVFKTLVGSAAGALVVAVVPMTGDLSLKALAAAAGAKEATMADPQVAERSSGYVVGGISPIGQKRPLATFIDESAEKWATIFVSAGRRGFELELAPADLLRLTHGRWAALAKPR